MGHFITARLINVPVISFSLRSMGAVFSFDFSGVGYLAECAVHLGGAAAGIFCAILGYLFFGTGSAFFCGVSLILSVINLIPVSGLDGGGALSCILSEFLLPDTVWRVTRWVSGVSLLILWGAVVWIELRVGANFGLLAFVIFLGLNME